MRTQIIDVPLEEAKSTIDRESEDFAGQIGHRKVGQCGWHYSAVIEGRDGKGRYRILDDEGDGTYNHKYLRLGVIAKAILTKGHGHVHMKKSLINYHKEVVGNEKRKEAANAAYSRHAAHHALLKKKGEMPDFSRVLGSTSRDEYSDELLEIARSEFGPMREARGGHRGPPASRRSQPRRTYSPRGLGRTGHRRQHYGSQGNLGGGHRPMARGHRRTHHWLRPPDPGTPPLGGV